MFGRNRDSIAGIELEVQALFEQHPDVVYDNFGKPTLPVSAIPAILQYHVSEGADNLLSDEEYDGFMNVLQSNGKPVDVNTIVQLYAIKTKHASSAEDPDSSAHNDSNSGSPSSRPSSRNSQGNGPPSILQKGASIEYPDSPFETKNRQRSRPLLPPSSFQSKKPLPASQSGRRRSDAGSYPYSDSESPNPYSSQHRRTRSRAPSNPVSPSPANTRFTAISSEPHSPPTSRPPSRAQSRNGYHSQTETPLHGISSTVFGQEHSTALPSAEGTHDDEGDYEYTARLGRINTSSTSSLVPEDRVESLTRINDELSRKLLDAERTLAVKLDASELELADLESRLEEMRQELAAKNREEKELRAKDRANVAQIQALEAEVSRLQRNLENSRVAFTTLHKQYQEQMIESEKYRDALRLKDEEIKEMARQSMRNAHDAEQRDQNRTANEIRIAQLEEELIAMREAEGNLDLQKAENLLLKETIDRLRFELDELTNNITTGSIGVGPSSHTGTASKSLGAELSRIHKQYQFEETGSETVVESYSAESEGGEEEEIKTIIRRKRKIGGRKFADVMLDKEYSDAYSQYRLSDLEKHGSPPSSKGGEEGDPIKRNDKMIMIPKLQIQHDSTLYADSPPSYTPVQLSNIPSTVIRPVDRESLTMEVLDKWHPSSHLTLDKIPGGISRTTYDEWQAVKKEVGIGCNVVDKAIAQSEIHEVGKTSRKSKRHGNRFYNIYNTYIYDDTGIHSTSSIPFYLVGGAIVLLAIQPFLSTVYLTPGIPNYMDRVSFHAANSLTPRGIGFDETTHHTTVDFFRMMLGGAQLVAGRIRQLPPT